MEPESTHQSTLGPATDAKQQGSLAAPKELVVTITATFTAEPIGDSLRFWLHHLGLAPARLEYSGYNQLFQELSATHSRSASRIHGANVLMVRIEDWGRAHAAGKRTAAIAATCAEFIGALTEFAKRATRPTILVLAPMSRRAADDSDLAALLRGLHADIRDATSRLRGITVVTDEDVVAHYPVDAVDDPDADQQSHIPFTPSYWTALATFVARKLRLLFQPPCKVIVTDADNTLWGGVVAEEGADQVRLTDPWRALQLFLRERKEAGMLLALASKNEERDVAAVFARPDMCLRRDDFVAWEVNWEAKSRNLAALAGRLQLGLDSFVFLDDNPVECAEVAANCPGMSTLVLPSDPDEIPAFLRHVWAFDFDAAAVTNADARRTEMYRQQGERNRFRNRASSFREFIEGLELETEIAPPAAGEYQRAAQLSQRTNQFNTSVIRRTAPELSSLVASGARQALLLKVRDRFGDYGDVGLSTFFADDDALQVDSFLLSCRVLGKGVEHRMLRALGLRALEAAANRVVIRFTRTERNQPAETFLRAVGANERADGWFELTSSDAAAARFDPDLAVSEDPADTESEAQRSGGTRTPDFGRIARDLNSIDSIAQSVARHFRRPRPDLPNALVRPRDDLEATLAAIWEQVLHVEEVGVTDSFVALGGKSLQAASITSRVREECGRALDLGVMLADPTVASLAAGMHRMPASVGALALPRAKQILLSPAQERLWFLDQFIANRAAYNIPVARRIRGPLNAAALQEAVRRVILRHEALRAVFGSEGGSGDVKISETPTVSLQHMIVGGEEEAIELATREARRPFDLAHEPPLRWALVSWSDREHVLVLNIHHIVCDGWSLGVLFRDLSTAYAAANSGREPAWASPRALYSDYAAWQKEQIARDAFRDDMAYWKAELSGAPSLLALPTDRTRPSSMSYEGGATGCEVSADVRNALESFAIRAGVTPFTLLLATWQVLLQRYSQQEDMVIGVPVAGRLHSATEDIVGCFVNTLAVRGHVSPEHTFVEHAQGVHSKMLGALAHQALPFELLVSSLGLERDLSRTPLFQVVIVLQDTPDEDFGAPGLEVSQLHVHNGGAKFDLVLEITPLPGAGYRLSLEFNASVFLPRTAQRILGQFTTLLDGVLRDEATQLKHVPLLSAAERSALVGGGQGIRRYGRGPRLHELFERQVERTPEAIALVGFGADGRRIELSYAELNRRANRVARQLRGLGVVPNQLVGLRTDRNAELVVGIVAILKSGAAYLPLDPVYPRDRVAFMLEDSAVQVVLSQSSLKDDLAGVSVICLDEPMAGDADAERNPVAVGAADDLAYVIYTSGSTGKPKGTRITHHNVCRLFAATEAWYGFNERDVWTLFHSYAFDFSVWEMWGALLYGGRVVVVPLDASRSIDDFHQLLVDERVTVLNQTPTAFRRLIDATAERPGTRLALRYVIFGGEALELQSLRPWFERYGDQTPRLVNMYGITETTVHVTYRPITLADLDGGAGSVIGVPLPDLRIYILDAQGEPVPLGVAGEMFVAGDGVGQGYLNRAELSEQRFVRDPFDAEPGARMYRTGDLARRLDGGDIEYLGRIDQQVKIRGFRIELGEIEAAISQHPDVRQVAVIAREDVAGDKRLVAYLVAASADTQLVDSLRQSLRTQLPDYMLPAHFVFLSALPLTQNGKLDRAALPAPAVSRADGAKPFIAPRNAIELAIANVWQAVLRVDSVGVDDHFFELGGDSILSIQVIARCRQLGLHFTPKDLFTRPTIAELAPVVRTAPAASKAQTGPVSGAVPLTPIQHWFFEQRFADPHHWNQAFMFDVPADLDPQVLGTAMRKLLARHDALRMRYRQGADGRWIQEYGADDATLSVACVDLSGVASSEQAAAIEAHAAVEQTKFDLANGPLVGAVHFKRGPALRGRVLLAVHHLVVDGVSWRVLIEDLESLYLAAATGRAERLPAKTRSLQSWARALHEHARSAAVHATFAHWRELAATPALKLPHHAAGQAPLAASGALVTRLSREDTRALLQRLPAVFQTQINDVLLTALALALHGWTGSRTLRIDLEGHGREHFADGLDVSRTVGWFTTLFPIALDVDPGADSVQSLRSIRDQLQQVPDRGLSHGLLRYLSDDAAVRDALAAMPPSPVAFNYLGQFDAVVADSTLFGFASESTGPWRSPRARRTHALEIVAMVRDGEMEITWHHDADARHEAAIANVAERMVHALRDLVASADPSRRRAPTPADFPLARLDAAALARVLSHCPQLEDVYPLTPMQRLFFAMEASHAGVGFEQWHFRLDGEVDAVRLRRAVEHVVERHSILRTAIVTDGGDEPLQVVSLSVSLPWSDEDWRSCAEVEQSRRLTELLAADARTGFDLARAPLMRVALRRVADTSYHFIWSTHHLYIDGWSWPIVFGDVSRAYATLEAGGELAAGGAVPYRRYVEWLGGSAPRSEEFWKAQLDGFSVPTPFLLSPPTAAPSDAIAGAEPFEDLVVALPAATTSALQALARNARVTLSAVFNGAWSLLLAHYSGATNVVFGAAFSGRPADIDGIESMVGPCVNNLPVRVEVDPSDALRAWLARLQRVQFDIGQNQYAPLEQIQRWAEVPWRHRLFDSLVVFQNYQVDADARGIGTGIRSTLISSPEETNYPLTLAVTIGQQLRIRLIFKPSAVARADVAQFVDDLSTALAAMATADTETLADILATLPAASRGRAGQVASARAAVRRSAFAAPSSEAEREIAAVWQDLFGVERVSLDDNFFDLGGHSMLLVQAHGRLKGRLREDLPIVALLQYPTVRSLARHVSRGAEADRERAAVATIDRAQKQREAQLRQRNLAGRRSP